jgi:mycothiol synthase
VRNLSSRPARPSDAQGILAVGIARDVADLGAPDWTLDDVHEEMAAAERAWVVEDGSGRLVAAALLESSDARVLVHPDSCGQGIGTHLRELVEEAAPPGTLLQQAVHGSNDAARALLEAAGYRAERHYWRMAMRLERPLPVASWPDGVEVRPYERDDFEATWAVVHDAFAEAPRKPSAGRFADDLSALALAADDGSIAGAVLSERWEDDQGFVAFLAAAEEWRGRGLGRALLIHALANMRAAGLVRAGLAVNGSNRSATALYESVGMAIESHADRYDKLLP